MRSNVLGFVVAAALVAMSAPVRANDMDVSLARLRIPAGDTDPMSPTFCPPTVAGGGTRAYCPDNAAWANLMSELGGSALPIVMSPARTVGYGGFQLAVEGSITGIDGGDSFWEGGTEGDERAGGEACAGVTPGLGCNRFANDVLFWSRLMARKGFPLGFELGTGFSYLNNTSLWAWALEVKWSLFEGFRHGLPAVIPDVSVRGMVNTVVGDPEFNLTTPSVDITISKPLIAFGTTRITPFVSWQVGWIFADSELVDSDAGSRRVRRVHAARHGRGHDLHRIGRRLQQQHDLPTAPLLTPPLAHRSSAPVPGAHRHRSVRLRHHRAWRLERHRDLSGRNGAGGRPHGGHALRPAPPVDRQLRRRRELQLEAPN